MFQAMVKSDITSANPGCFRAVCRSLQVLGALMLFGGVTHFSTPALYVYDALRMRSWDPTPAVVLKSELKATPGDEKQYAYATYRYQVQGINHEGERIDPAGRIFATQSDQTRLAALLANLQQSAAPTTAYVNPEDPTESVLYPQFKFAVLGWSLLGPTIFTVFGLSLMAIPTLSLRRERQRASAKAAHPGQPWMWRDDWAARQIRTENYNQTGVLAGAAIIYLFGVMPIGLLILNQHGWAFWSWPTALLLLVGWGFFNGTRTTLKASRKWKHATFRLGAAHGLVGGPLAGVVEIPVNTSAETTFRIRLECRETSRDGDGDVQHSTIWHDQNKVQPTSSSERAGNTIIPVYFAIPYACEPTDSSDSQRIRWRLTVDEGSDTSPRGVFDVPVFKTAASSRTYKEDRSVLEPYQPADDLQQTVASCCRVEPLPGDGEELRFTMFQAWALWAALVLIGLCIAGITTLLYFEFHPAWTIMPGIFTAIVLAGMLEMLLWGSRLAIRPAEITISAGIAGFRKVRTVPRDLLGETTIETSKEWQGQQTTDWHSIRLILVLPNEKFDETKIDPDDTDFDLNGEPRLLPPERLVVAKRIDSRRTAEQLAEWLREKLSVPRAVESIA